MRCLWLARDVPFPLDSGDKIYTAKLAQALAQADVDVTMIAHRSAGEPVLPADWPVTLTIVDGGKYSTSRALFSIEPLYSAVHPTPAYRSALTNALAQRWEAIVIDQLGSGWTLPQLQAYRHRQPHCKLVHISHNHETSLWRGMARQSQTGPLKRIALKQNALKVKAAENRMVRAVDLVTAITEEDVQLYRGQTTTADTLVLTPGFSGLSLPDRPITLATPRHVVLVGSFRWAIKQENLRQFLALADPAFAQQNIHLDVVGDMPAKLREQLSRGLRATTLHGFVDDIAPIYRRARIAVVPELIGGGFKLKFLDYFFARLPIASIAAAAAGLPAPLRDSMLLSSDLIGLTELIGRTIDDCDSLNRLQRQAFERAQSLYRWSDRGAMLRAAMMGDSTRH